MTRLQRTLSALFTPLLAFGLLWATGPSLAQTAAPAPPPRPCTDPGFAQMDFWLGRWELSWDGAPGTPAGQGTNTITRELGGCVIHESFAAAPAAGGLVGRSDSVYQPSTQRWRQTWVDNQGSYIALVGGKEGDRFVLAAVSADGKPAQRMIFESITERSLIWRWQRSTDAGASWTDQWVIRYRRAEPSAAQPDSAITAEALAERMLSAIGGRSAWAALHNTVNDSQQFRLSEPLQVRSVISMDFLRPRFRIDTSAPGLKLSRVVDGERDWRLTREGQIAPVPPATRSEDLEWYAGHVYRTLSRIARREAPLQLRLGTEGRLEVHEAGRRIAWFRLNAAGEPVAFSGVGDGPGAVSGPWSVVEQGIRHPAWVSSTDGSWRAMLTRLQVNVPLQDRDFQPPP